MQTLIELPDQPDQELLFLSDLHLDPSQPRVFEALAGLLGRKRHRLQALFILGDLTEVWVGDDDDSPLATALSELLASCAKDCQLFLMHGNRDFLLGEAFAQATGAQLLADPCVLRWQGQRILLSHGDAYCTADHAYQQIRQLLRSPAWQADILAKTLNERRALAAGMRQQSLATNANKAANIMDVTASAVEAALAQARAQLMVHGHTHRPGLHLHPLPSGPARRYVLGDWDHCGWYLQAMKGSFSLRCFPLDQAPS